MRGNHITRTRLLRRLPLWAAAVFFAVSPAGAQTAPAAQASKPGADTSRVKTTSGVAPKNTGKTVLLQGIVLSSEDYSPLPGVGVMITGTNTGTVTDMEGRYKVSVPENTVSMTYSSMGYLNKELKLSYNPAVFQVVYLDESAQTIGDAVVTAFGTTQSKESMVSSVDSVEPRNFSGGDGDLTTTFSGNIAGMMATQLSGEPGSGSTFTIRGLSTFGDNTEPIYVLDGVEVSVDVINGLSPESIATMSVLKDAAATALYGSRGANGAIIVNTKTGTSSNRINVNVHLYSTLITPTERSEMADGVTYMKNYNEARLTRGYEPLYSQEKIDKTRSRADKWLYPDVNWYDLLFNNHAFSEQASVVIRGGGNRVNYFLNAVMYNESGMFRNAEETSYNTNINFQRYTVVSNVTAKMGKYTRASIRLNAQYTSSYYPYTNNLNSVFYWAMEANPVEFSPVYPSSWLPGETNFTVYGSAPSWDANNEIQLNPYAELSKGYRRAFNNLTTLSARVDHNFKKLVRGLKAWAQVAITDRSFSQRSYYKTPHHYQLTGMAPDPVTGEPVYDIEPIGTVGTNFFSVVQGRSGNRKITVQANAEYARTFKKSHYVNLTAVYHMTNKVNTQPTNYYQMLPEREQGLAFRVGYRYRARYLVELNFGYNGSENLAPGLRWGFFPSAAFGWILSKERFWESLQKVVDYAKLRFSIGYAGNDAIRQRFPYVSELQMNYWTNFWKGNNFYRQRGNQFASVGNPDATWERSFQTNVGLDFSVKKDLVVTTEYFREERTGIFMRLNLPSTMGLSGVEPYDNIGAVLKYGNETKIKYNHVINKDMYIAAQANFTWARNKVTANAESKYKKYPNTSVIGYPINSIYGLTAIGLFKDQEDIDNSPRQTYMPDYKPGDIKYKDVNGDGVIDDNDMSVIGRPRNAEIAYGFSVKFGYKRLDASVTFAGQARRSILLSNIHPFRDNSRQGFNMFQWIADNHWREDRPNPDAAYPRLDYRYNLNNAEVSTFWIRNGAFLRAKQFELGYSFKKAARIYMNVTNPFVISAFHLWDPEKGSGNGLSYPLKRTYRLGVTFQF